eukprot:6157691-Amphidinium_carterae.1
MKTHTQLERNHGCCVKSWSRTSWRSDDGMNRECDRTAQHLMPSCSAEKSLCMEEKTIRLAMTSRA